MQITKSIAAYAVIGMAGVILAALATGVASYAALKLADWLMAVGVRGYTEPSFYIGLGVKALVYVYMGTLVSRTAASFIKGARNG